MVAPVLFQVGLPCPRDPREPNLWDRLTLQSVQSSFGRFLHTGGTSPPHSLPIPGAITLDAIDAWRHDRYQFDTTSLGPIIPFHEGVAGEAGAVSFAPAPNQDVQAIPLQVTGHHIVPILTVFDVSGSFELNGVQCEVMVDKDQTDSA